MKARATRVALVLIVATSGAGLVIEACSFPEVTFATSEAGTPATIDHDAGADGATDVLVGDGRAPQHDVDPEGGTQEAGSAGDAAQIDASGCQTCDCDKDGFNRLDLDSGCDGGPNGKLPDCDDLNAAIHPGLGFITDPWPPGTEHTPVGDWDCSGETTRQYAYDGTCAGLSTCADGFLGNPPCGGTSDYVTCAKGVLPLVGLTCSEKTHEVPGKRTQGCR